VKGKMQEIKTQSLALHHNSGQAILEYVLLLSIIIGMGTILVGGVQRTRDNMWKRILCEVSAACPGRKSTESAKKALPKASFKCKN